MYTSQDLETDLKALDPNFAVVPNGNRPGLSNIFYAGKNYDLHAVPTEEIREEVDQMYRYQFPDGRSARHWTKKEILDQCESFLTRLKSGALSEDYE